MRRAVAEALSGWPPPVFDPAGPYAGSITTLAWVLMAMGAAVLLIVLAALWIALFGGKRLRERLGGTWAIWLGGIAFPVVVLTLLLIYGLTLTRHLSEPAKGDEVRMRITGEMWWWRVTYLDAEGRAQSLDANELHIPVGRPVVLELESSDVIHSFWIPRLSGKLDMIPGRRNVMRIQADEPGVFSGQCAEYCGGPHALMGFLVIAHPEREFEALMRARSLIGRQSVAGDEAERGRSLFRTAGCAACHRVAGTDANGMAGPDLTHVGSRRSLGAGILPNNRGTMIGWIGDSQSIKPGNRMPPYSILPAKDLRALAIYLETLK